MALNEKQINFSLQKLMEDLNELRIGEANDVPLLGSIGAAYGTVGEDSFQSLCEKADAALY